MLIVVIVVLAQNCGELWGEQTRCIGEKERDEEASIWRAAEQTDEKESKRMRRRANG